jgi:hypothetical protein
MTLSASNIARKASSAHNRILIWRLDAHHSSSVRRSNSASAQFERPARNTRTQVQQANYLQKDIRLRQRFTHHYTCSNHTVIKSWRDTTRRTNIISQTIATWKVLQSFHRTHLHKHNRTNTIHRYMISYLHLLNNNWCTVHDKDGCASNSTCSVTRNREVNYPRNGNPSPHIQRKIMRDICFSIHHTRNAKEFEGKINYCMQLNDAINTQNAYSNKNTAWHFWWEWLRR